MDKANFINDYVKALWENNAAVLAGAGLSKGAGYVDWKSLLKELADEIKLDVEKEQHDLVAVAQYYCNSKGNQRGKINQVILDEFSDKLPVTENHKILASLPIRTYWTTNYDTMIERALEDERKNPDIKITENNLSITKPNSKAIVYKMHGDVNHVDGTIITKDDYERYDKTHHLFMQALEGDLVSKTFLFIGFSFNDPNLNYILSRVRVALYGNQRPHYCILKRVNEAEFGFPADFNYALVKQNLFIEDLKRFSINTVLVDDFSEILEILQNLRRRYLNKSIFVSGSAEEYGVFPSEAAKSLLYHLSMELVSRKYRIISGFGKGVGSYVINGVLEHNYGFATNDLKENLVLYPFPQDINEEQEVSDLYNKYRRDMISDAGIAIFVFGNKAGPEGQIINAEGVRKEFEIARQMNVFPMPIGVTGYQAKEIYQIVMDSFDEYYPNMPEVRNLLEGMNYDLKDCDIEKDVENIVSTIVTIVEIINKIC